MAYETNIQKAARPMQPCYDVCVCLSEYTHVDLCKINNFCARYVIGWRVLPRSLKNIAATANFFLREFACGECMSMI